MVREMESDGNLFSRPLIHVKYFTMNILTPSIYTFTYLNIRCHHFLELSDVYKEHLKVYC